MWFLFVGELASRKRPLTVCVFIKFLIDTAIGSVPRELKEEKVEQMRGMYTCCYRYFILG